MSDFITLREFLQITPDYDPGRPAHRDRAAIEYVALYDLARASWERFGDAGPPVGSQVMILESGHGCGMPSFHNGKFSGVTRTFDGIYPHDDRFFAVSRPGKYGHAISLVNRSYWWMQMAPVEEQ